ncbi:hypothetical protein TNIN_86321 [Trichonephila inaurata madagascariensis]|uniref:Uncharacterized protein n=1 Tax=Trichonephila inaurata madagascariensis TaxID=2747483 RepID=A0A8X6YP41_9ARAC|nr:hypothetical protein TNIN_86321 [Trichonephila inaurata madagascariensis]
MLILFLIHHSTSFETILLPSALLHSTGLPERESFATVLFAIVFLWFLGSSPKACIRFLLLPGFLLRTYGLNLAVCIIILLYTRGLLRNLGFTPDGIRNDSYASRWQNEIPSVRACSLFTICQRIASFGWKLDILLIFFLLLIAYIHK